MAKGADTSRSPARSGGRPPLDPPNNNPNADTSQQERPGLGLMAEPGTSLRAWAGSTPIVGPVARPLTPVGGQRGGRGTPLPKGGRLEPAWMGAVNPPAASSSFTTPTGESVAVGSYPAESRSRLSPDVHNYRVPGGDVSRNRSQVEPKSTPGLASRVRPPAQEFKRPSGWEAGDMPPLPKSDAQKSEVASTSARAEHEQKTRYKAAESEILTSEGSHTRLPHLLNTLDRSDGGTTPNPDYVKRDKDWQPTPNPYAPREVAPKEPNEAHNRTAPTKAAAPFTAYGKAGPGWSTARRPGGHGPGGSVPTSPSYGWLENPQKPKPAVDRTPNSGYRWARGEAQSDTRGADLLRKEAVVRRTGIPDTKSNDNEGGMTPALDLEATKQAYVGNPAASAKMPPLVKGAEGSDERRDYDISRRRKAYIHPGKPGQPETAKYAPHSVEVRNVSDENTDEKAEGGHSSEWPSAYWGNTVAVKNSKGKIEGTRHEATSPVLKPVKSGIITARSKGAKPTNGTDDINDTLFSRTYGNVRRGDFAPKSTGANKNRPSTGDLAKAAGAAALVDSHNLTDSYTRGSMIPEVAKTAGVRDPNNSDRRDKNPLRDRMTALPPNKEDRETVVDMIPARTPTLSSTGEHMVDSKGRPAFTTVHDTETGRPVMVPRKEKVVDKVTGEEREVNATVTRPKVTTRIDESIKIAAPKAAMPTQQRQEATDSVASGEKRDAANEKRAAKRAAKPKPKGAKG